jgi:hypothetical protein
MCRVDILGTHIVNAWYSLKNLVRQRFLLRIISMMWCLVEDCLWVAKALGADNKVITTREILVWFLGVWWGSSWLNKILQRALVRVLLECDLSARWEVDLWRVLVSGIDSGRSVFAGRIPEIEVLLEAQGVGSPWEDVLSGHPKDLYVLGTSS